MVNVIITTCYMYNEGLFKYPSTQSKYFDRENNKLCELMYTDTHS